MALLRLAAAILVASAGAWLPGGLPRPRIARPSRDGARLTVLLEASSTEVPSRDRTEVERSFAEASGGADALGLDAFKSLPEISALLADGELSAAELDTMWARAAGGAGDAALGIEGFAAVLEEVRARVCRRVDANAEGARARSR